MKLLLLSIFLAASGHSITFTNDFAISCKGLIQIEVISSFYNPGTYCTDHPKYPHNNPHLPQPQYCGRANPIPPKGGVKVKATVIDTKNFYCHSFKSKLGAELKNYTFNAVFYPLDMTFKSVNELKSKLTGQIVPFSIDQKFAFNIGTLLPLYPHMMGETLIIKAKLDDGASLSHHIKVNSQKAYGVSTVENANDQDKLNTLKTIIEFNQDKELWDAISQRDLEKVLLCLKNGANPNYNIADPNHNVGIEHQPYSPLRLVIFCISDCLLTGEDLQKHYSIAKLLIMAGACPIKAEELSINRYGTFEKKSLKEIYNLSFDSLGFYMITELIHKEAQKSKKN